MEEEEGEGGTPRGVHVENVRVWGDVSSKEETVT